jgi:hypothetical protein
MKDVFQKNIDDVNRIKKIMIELDQIDIILNRKINRNNDRYKELYVMQNKTMDNYFKIIKNLN